VTPELWQKIDEIYHAARGRNVLADADPDVKREVEALLEQDTRVSAYWTGLRRCCTVVCDLDTESLGHATHRKK
jgi:hypothetical protein